MLFSFTGESQTKRCNCIKKRITAIMMNHYHTNIYHSKHAYMSIVDDGKSLVKIT